MPGADRVTIAVPVYRGAPFVSETLQSIQGQTHREIEVVVSLDGPDPEAEAACRPFLGDSRFRLVVQPERLGWVGHVNWLSSRAGTPYWCCHPQDDVIEPEYVAALLDEAARAPEAAVVYCDIASFGLVTRTLIQPSVTGSSSARQLALLYGHHSAVAFRGLTRVEAIRRSGGIRPNEVEDFSADTTWMAALALWGELRRVPRPLYRKRYHAGNTHVRWAGWPVERRLRAWTVHCADMLEQAMRSDATEQERRLLWLAAVTRLTSARTASGYLPVASMPASQREACLESFLEHVRTERAIDLPRLLATEWDALEHWTRGFCGRRGTA